MCITGPSIADFGDERSVDTLVPVKMPSLSDRNQQAVTGRSLLRWANQQAATGPPALGQTGQLGNPQGSDLEFWPPAEENRALIGSS